MEISTNSKFCVIFAPKEFSEEQIVLRNMTDRTERKISIKELTTDPQAIFNL